MITKEIKSKVLYPYTNGTKWILTKDSYWDDSDPKYNMGHGHKDKGFKFIVTPFTTPNDFRYGNNYSNWFEKLINVAKPILKPLSYITDEHANEIVTLMGGFPYRMESKLFEVKGMDSLYMYEVSGVTQHLQSNGYDLPHYLLGGKTLKEAGLAVYEK